MKYAFYALAATFSLLLFLPSTADAQRRDYLTEQEIELIRDAQEIDKRIEVLTKAIDRRFAALNNETSEQIGKDAEKWGEIPKGNRIQLISDIAKILQKAVDDIDDVAARSKDSKLFPKAVQKLAEEAQKFLPQFQTQLDKISDGKERGTILNSIDICNQIIDAAAKMPKEEKKKKN